MSRKRLSGVKSGKLPATPLLIITFVFGMLAFMGYFYYHHYYKSPSTIYFAYFFGGLSVTLFLSVLLKGHARRYQESYYPIKQQATSGHVGSAANKTKGTSPVAVTGLVISLVSLFTIAGMAYWIKLELTYIRDSIAHQEAELADTKNAISDYKADVDKLNSRIDEMTTEVEEYKKQIAGTESRLDEATSRVDAADSTISDFKTQLEGVNAELGRGNSRLAEADATFNDFKSQLAGLKSELSENKSKKFASERAINEISYKLKQLENRISDTEHRIDEFKE